jgi:hypothetical protein
MVVVACCVFVLVAAAGVSTRLRPMRRKPESRPPIQTGFAATISPVCCSHEHTFVQPSTNFHRLTHSTGAMQCFPRSTGFSKIVRQHPAFLSE